MSVPKKMNPSSFFPTTFQARFQQHLNHLNDLAFNHTKMLKEMMEKSSTPDDLINKTNRKRSHSSSSNEEQRPLKQMKIQSASVDQQVKDQRNDGPLSVPLMNYLHDFLRINPMNAPLTINKFNDNLPQMFPTVHPSFLAPAFVQNRFAYPFHHSTAKRRRTKVTDTRLSPRLPTKCSRSVAGLPSEDFSEDDDDDEPTSSDHSSDHFGNERHDLPLSSVLTSVHLRKAKLIFFYTRYPSSSMLKVYFPDVRFNKLITAQLVKWFSNFREFFYSQIEKYARQHLNEGIRQVEELIVAPNSDLCRVLNLHYNRSNQIEMPNHFREVVQITVREFFHAIHQHKDHEASWKKNIYKVIQRLDEPIPEYFKNDHWMHVI